MKIEYNNLYTHFVFTTLNRMPLILENFRERIEKYHQVFVNEFPEKTLTLFREAVNKFSENNLGRDKNVLYENEKN
jgi:hypothetical protein